MPAVQNIILTDRAGTPVAHTFTPESVLGGVGSVVEAGTSAVGNKRFTISGRRDAQRKWRNRITLTVPVVQTETVNGVSRDIVVRTAYATLDFTFDEASLAQERKDLVSMLACALGANGAATTTKTLVEDSVVNQQNVYSS
jgi:hypothetical protein